MIIYIHIFLDRDSMFAFREISRLGRYMFKKMKDVIPLIIIIMAISMTGNYYLQLKSSYYVDEGMTLFLSNGQYTGAVTSETEYGFGDFLKEFVWKDTVVDTVKNIYGMLREVMTAGNYSQEGTVEWYDAARSMLQGRTAWVTGDELAEQITTSRGKRFQYLQVYLNQVVDVHPPFYYFIVHTVFSFFPNSYSDYYLFGINMFFLLITCILVFSLFERLMHNRTCGYLAVIMYGFSQGFFSCAMYFRMYALETFWIIATLYVYLRVKEKQWQFGKKDCLLIFITAVLGFGTHYYYILYLVPLFCITCIRLMKRKRKKQMKQYIKVMVTAGVVSLIIWPFSLYHILFGYRGTEAIANLNMNGMVGRLIGLGKIVLHTVFLDHIGLAVCFLAVVLVCAVLQYGHQLPLLSWLKSNGMEICVPVLVYGIVVIKVAPVVADRYIMGLLPICFIVISIYLISLARGLSETFIFDRYFAGNGNESISRHILRNGEWISVALGVIYAVATFSLTTPEYLYLGQRDLHLSAPLEKREMNCLMVSDDDYRGFPEVLKLMEYNQIMVIEEKNLDLLENEQPDDPSMTTIIYVLNSLDQENILAEVVGVFGKEKTETDKTASDIEGFDAYIL